MNKFLSSTLVVAILTALATGAISIVSPRIAKRKDVRPNLVEATTVLTSYYKTKMLKENQAVLYSRLVKIATEDLKAEPQRVDLQNQLKTYTDARNETLTKAIEYSDKLAIIQGKIQVLLVDLHRGFPWNTSSDSIKNFLADHANATYLIERIDTLRKEKCLAIEDTLFVNVERVSKKDQAKLKKLIETINNDLAGMPDNIVFAVALFFLIAIIICILIFLYKKVIKIPDGPSNVIEKYFVVEFKDAELLKRVLEQGGFIKK